MSHQPDLHRDPAESARLQRRTNRRTTAITVAAWATAGAVVVGATQFGWGPFSGGLGGLADIAGGAQGELTHRVEAGRLVVAHDAQGSWW